MSSSEDEIELKSNKNEKNKLTYALICNYNYNSKDSIKTVHVSSLDNFFPQHKNDFSRNKKYKLWIEKDCGVFRYVYILLLGSKYILSKLVYFL